MQEKEQRVTFLQWVCLTLGAFVIVAMVTPVFAGGGPSITTSCISNLKQLGTATQLYLGDWDGIAPHAEIWADEIFPYTKTEKLLNCPSEGKFGYAMSSEIAGRKLADGPAQSSTIAFFDCRTIGRGVTTDPIRMPIPGRHHGKNCVAFVDGHAKALSTR